MMIRFFSALMCVGVMCGGALWLPEARGEASVPMQSEELSMPRSLNGCWVRCEMKGQRSTYAEWFYVCEGVMLYYPLMHESATTPPATPEGLKSADPQADFAHATEYVDSQGRYWLKADMTYQAGGRTAEFGARTIGAATNYTFARSKRRQETPGRLHAVRKVGKTLQCDFDGMCLVRADNGHGEDSVNRVVSVVLFMP